MNEEGCRPTKIRIRASGRVVIPARYRKALGLKAGDRLFAICENDEIRLLTLAGSVRQAQAMVRQFVPEGVSLVDELLADRRREG
jgi:AbrB family looped-hinge helix DNA binding protein